MMRRNHWGTISMAVFSLLAACAATAWSDSPANLRNEFAKKLETSIRQGEAGFLNERFDVAAFVERMFTGREIPKDVITQQREQFAKDVPLGNSLAETVKQGGKFKFLRLHGNAGETRALFRMLTDGGFNYFDFTLIADNNTVRVADVYIFSAGELLSESMLRASLPALGRHNRGVAKTFSKAEADYMEYAPQVRAIRSAMRRHDPERALTHYRRLPRTVQRQRNVALLRVYAGVAQGWDSVECERAIAHLKQHCPDSPALQMLLFQYHNARKEYAQMLPVIAALKQATGDLAYTEYLRGNVLYKQKKPERARTAFMTAVMAEPEFDEAHAALVALALERKDWQAVTRRLLRLQELNVEFGDLTKIPIYAEYVKTSEYANWKSARRGE